MNAPAIGHMKILESKSAVIYGAGGAIGGAGDPLRSIRDIRKIRLVLHDGRVVEESYR